jgi:GrpB-like predicted nucleotidyltransferase (UPF0157 family)
MKTKRVIVLPYNCEWKEEFVKIKNELDQAIGKDIISIEHVGSTSIEGLAAKPVIDIDIIIDRIKFENIKNGLKDIGYRHEGDLGVNGREAFEYDNKEHLMKHHLYVCDKYNEELKRHIVFRDWLRKHPGDADMYGNIKIEMAKKYPNDIDSYIEGKTPCVIEIYQKCGLIR